MNTGRSTNNKRYLQQYSRISIEFLLNMEKKLKHFLTILTMQIKMKNRVFEMRTQSLTCKTEESEKYSGADCWLGLSNRKVKQ